MSAFESHVSHTDSGSEIGGKKKDCDKGTFPQPASMDSQILS